VVAVEEGPRPSAVAATDSEVPVSRVVYIGNFEPPASTENEVLRALRSLGHDVFPRQEQEWASWLLPVEADVLLWTRTRSLSDQIDVEVRAALLADCESRGIPTVGYHLDRWCGLAREAEIEHDPFFRVSLLCTADGGHDREWKDAGVNHEWFPPAISEFECGLGHDFGNAGYDVAFVGSWQHYGHSEWWPERARMLEHVRSWYGDRFECFPAPGTPAVRGAALADVYATAKVVVGDSCLAPAKDGTPVERYWSDRVPETLGRGGLLVHPYVEGLSDEFHAGLPEEPIPRYLMTYPLGDMDALHDRIELLLRAAAYEPDRRLLQAAAIGDVKRGHTYTVRMRQLWERLGL
jgi:hypothetical protein